MLGREQISFYHEQGYLGVENVLSADEANEPRRVTDEFVAKSRQVTEKDDVFDLEPATAQTRPNCAG